MNVNCYKISHLLLFLLIECKSFVTSHNGCLFPSTPIAWLANPCCRCPLRHVCVSSTPTEQMLKCLGENVLSDINSWTTQVHSGLNANTTINSSVYPVSLIRLEWTNSMVWWDCLPQANIKKLPSWQIHHMRKSLFPKSKFIKLWLKIDLANNLKRRYQLFSFFLHLQFSFSYVLSLVYSFRSSILQKSPPSVVLYPTSLQTCFQDSLLSFWKLVLVSKFFCLNNQ